MQGQTYHLHFSSGGEDTIVVNDHNRSVGTPHLCTQVQLNEMFYSLMVETILGHEVTCPGQSGPG